MIMHDNKGKIYKWNYQRVCFQSKSIDEGSGYDGVGQDGAPITKHVETNYETSGYITLSIDRYFGIWPVKEIKTHNDSGNRTIRWACIAEEQQEPALQR